jgi:tellurite resistance protein
MCVQARQGLWLDFVQRHANIGAIVNLREIFAVLKRFRLQLQGYKKKAFLEAVAAARMLKSTATATPAEGAADLLSRISATMSLADGRDSADEYGVIHEICVTVKLS